MTINYRDQDTGRAAGGEFVASFQGFEDEAAGRISAIHSECGHIAKYVQVIAGQSAGVPEGRSERTVLHRDHSPVAHLL